MSSPAPLRLLVVDDEPDVRAVLKRSLKQTPIAFAEAASVEDAIAAAESEAYDLVICDLRLADASGLSVLAWFRQHRPGTRRVLMTGHGMNDDELRPHLADGTIEVFLPKPWPMDELRAIVESAHHGRFGA